MRPNPTAPPPTPAPANLNRSGRYAPNVAAAQEAYATRAGATYREQVLALTRPAARPTVSQPAQRAPSLPLLRARAYA